MAREHTVRELRDLLRELRREIERLEMIRHYPNTRSNATRQRIREAKTQEVVLLAKLDELETKQ